MDLANMPSLGGTRIDAYCACGYQAGIDISALPNNLAVPSIKDRLRRTKCAQADRDPPQLDRVRRNGGADMPATETDDEPAATLQEFVQGGRRDTKRIGSCEARAAPARQPVLQQEAFEEVAVDGTVLKQTPAPGRCRGPLD
jgi:hypothetical protein